MGSDENTWNDLGENTVRKVGSLAAWMREDPPGRMRGRAGGKEGRGRDSLLPVLA